MNLTFINPGFEHSIDSILLFQKDDTTPYLPAFECFTHHIDVVIFIIISSDAKFALAKLFSYSGTRADRKPAHATAGPCPLLNSGPG